MSNFENEFQKTDSLTDPLRRETWPHTTAVIQIKDPIQKPDSYSVLMGVFAADVKRLGLKTAYDDLVQNLGGRVLLANGLLVNLPVYTNRLSD